MKKLLFAIIAVLSVACTSPYIPSIDNPSYPTDEDVDIIAYIDKRLAEEYYWLDEVEEKSSSFNRRLAWEEYLDNSLLKLTTNADDGHTNKDGSRTLYSYIREINKGTRAEVSGFGIALHYTIVKISKDVEYYGFVIEDVYGNSPAEEAGIKRGDVIVQVDKEYITRNNYLARFNAIENNSATSLKLSILRQVDSKEFEVTLSKGSYKESPVAYYDVFDFENYDRKIGYLVYTGFESEYDEELLAALSDLATRGAQDIILDLRTNGGGSVISAIKLASSLLGPTYANTPFCIVERNPRNISSDKVEEFRLEDTGISLAINHLTIIASGYSASASEIIIEGMRGLDIPVTIIGSTTEGKNCGMDVTRRTIGTTYLEYAPITFMCFNAKGFGGWGEGITPDIDLTTENEIGPSDENYPIPRTEWGDITHDIGLVAAIASVTGKKVSTADTRSLAYECELKPSIAIERPAAGTLVYR